MNTESAPAGVPLPVAPARLSDPRATASEPFAKQALPPAADPIADVPLQPQSPSITGGVRLPLTYPPSIVHSGVVVGTALVLTLIAWGIAHLFRTRLATLPLKNVVWFAVGVLIALGAVLLQPVLGRAIFPDYYPSL